MMQTKTGGPPCVVLGLLADIARCHQKKNQYAEDHAGERAGHSRSVRADESERCKERRANNDCEKWFHHRPVTVPLIHYARQTGFVRSRPSKLNNPRSEPD